MGDRWEMINASRRMNLLEQAKTCYLTERASQVKPLISR
jgi:hypothetical protein